MSFVEDDKGQYDDIVPIFWASGACLLTRTNIYKKMGGLDPIFFAHQEEIDFCWRLHNKYDSSSKNTPIIIVYPQAVVYHVGGGTLGYESPRKTFLNFRNNLLMLYKNVPRKHLWWLMIIRFFMDYLAAMQMALTKQWPNAKAVWSARQEYNKMKKAYPIRTQQSSAMLVKRSIVLDYYLLGKKK
jgi:GT2 family glycosyltransferase